MTEGSPSLFFLCSYLLLASFAEHIHATMMMLVAARQTETYGLGDICMARICLLMRDRVTSIECHKLSKMKKFDLLVGFVIRCMHAWFRFVIQRQCLTVSEDGDTK